MTPSMIVHDLRSHPKSWSLLIRTLEIVDTCIIHNVCVFTYRIAGYFQGGNFSRMHDAVSFRGENFRGWLTRS